MLKTLSKDETITLVFVHKDDSSKIQMMDVLVEDLFSKSSDDFYEMLESKHECASTFCNKESFFNACGCEGIYEDYEFSHMVIELMGSKSKKHGNKKR